MVKNITDDRKKYMKEYYQKNKQKFKESSYNQYRRKMGIPINQGLQVKKGKIIVDFN